MMHKPQPIDSFENLRSRLDRLFKEPSKRKSGTDQLPLSLSLPSNPEREINHPSESVAEFLNFLTDSLPDGDLYLFGGILRDVALLGRRGFSSDIDVVVEGSWDNCVSYLEHLGASKNKFGGYRLEVAGWPVDIWNAKETWAIRQGLVPYRSIASLTETTVLNWDAILMNWRTRNFVCRENYIEELKLRMLDIVLEQNPNPLGMTVRVLRHLYMKDARKISSSAAEYLANCARTYRFEDVKNYEISSYKNSVIQPAIYRFFEYLNEYDDLDIRHRFSIASDLLERELGLEKPD